MVGEKALSNSTRVQGSDVGADRETIKIQIVVFKHTTGWVEVERMDRQLAWIRAYP